MEVTITLAENVYHDFQQLAEKSSRRVDEVIAEKVQATALVDAEEDLLATRSDEEILALANLKLPKAQARRVSQLVDRQQSGLMTSAEKVELDIYTELYQIGNLRKARGIVEAVKRGLVHSPGDLK